MVFDFFKKKKKEEEFRIEDLVLSKLKTGFMVDYDMKTYIVAAYNKYQWDEGGVTDEWELKSGNEIWYLERTEEDGEVEWSLCRKLAISELQGDMQVKSCVTKIRRKSSRFRENNSLSKKTMWVSFSKVARAKP